MSAGADHACGLRSDATITCWGNNTSQRSEAPGGQFSAVSAGTWHSCGLRADATITCWGENSYGQTAAPAGTFTAINSGWLHSCALRTDTTVACWGDNTHGQTAAPAGTFTAVTAAGSHSCGLRADASIACWGNNTYGQAAAPAGTFTAVAAAAWHTCGVLRDGAITCWGAQWNGQIAPPVGRFSAVAVGAWHSCGLRADGTVDCWGHYDRLADPPDGSFTSVTTGDRHACGLRADGTAMCWALAPLEPLPDGVHLPATADSANCRPSGGQSHMTAGFPRPAEADDATGTTRIGVLFLDFPDAAATHSTQREAELSLPDTERYLESASYGDLDIEFVPLHGWLRAEHAHTHYLRESSFIGNVMTLGAVEEVAVRLADPDFDFSGLNGVLIVMPSTHFSAGDAHWGLSTEEGIVPTFVRINILPHEDPLDMPLPWHVLAPHELLHTLGLVDYYSYTARELPDAPPGKIWVTSFFGPMGLSALILADERDPRLFHTVHHPDGTRSTVYANSLDALEMLAWSRWQLGWLDESQVSCITDAEATVNLAPVAAPGNGIAMAAIPLSDTEVLVMESRRRIGYDAPREFRWADDGHTRFPALATEGVLVYTVDVSRASGELPLRIVAESSGRQIEGYPILSDGYPILTEGRSVTIGGYTITVESATDATHTLLVGWDVITQVRPITVESTTDATHTVRITKSTEPDTPTTYWSDNR